MADSAFWRDLAATFLLIPGHGMLRADGQYTVGSGEAWSWRLGGGAREFMRDTFKTLARRGAFESAPAGTTDLLVAWLEAIRKEHINFRSDKIATEVNSEGREESQYVLGTIDRVCEASAILCGKLEAQAIQTEFEEKQRNDPQNWSPLRRQFEAFRGIKKLITGPHETIPEALVRDVLAQQYGIKPEEVTRKQIQFEVSGLLPDFPAITVVPLELLHEQGAPEPATLEKISRNAFVTPLLEANGWSILDWANEARVSHATAIDYLRDTTAPYRSTRLKLAKALGVPVEQLPQ